MVNNYQVTKLKKYYRFSEKKTYEKQDHSGRDQLKGHLVQDHFCPVFVFLPSGYGEKRGVSDAEQAGKSQDQRRDRKSQSYAGKGYRAVKRHMPDKDPVYDIIQYLDHLGQHDRHRLSDDDLPDCSVREVPSGLLQSITQFLHPDDRTPQPSPYQIFYFGITSISRWILQCCSFSDDGRTTSH